jgi:UDP-N-acetylmuramoyl-tripeptide--D-alanyl-D-alanine ligase
VALVNNAQREHQEFMATVEAVARENGAVLARWRRRRGRVPGRRSLHRCGGLAGRASSCLASRIRAPGFLQQARWQLDHWQAGAATPAGALAFELHVAGRHNVRNALAARPARWPRGRRWRRWRRA